MSILARRQLRLVAQQVLSILTGVTVSSPGDWEVQPVSMPDLKLRATDDRKQAVVRGVPEFTSVVTLEVLITDAAATAEEAQDRIEALGQKVEAAFFSAQPLVQLTQQFPTVTTSVAIVADGSQHVARAQMRIECEVFEAFDPTEINPDDYPALQQVNLHVDTARPFDLAGTYTDPAFPEAVAPAPRTAGPDGRDEGYLEIPLT